VKSFVSYF
jgi:hypothetical protein